MEIGDERESVTKDMLIDSPAKVPHRLLNDGNETFRFLVVKTPRQSDPARRSRRAVEERDLGRRSARWRQVIAGLKATPARW